MRLVGIGLLALAGVLAVTLAPASISAHHGGGHGRDDFADPSVLITTEELAELLRVDLSIRIIDVRTTARYEGGHVPYALSLPLGAILDPYSRIPGARLSDEELAWAFGALGIGGDTFVVVYDDQGGHQAARLFWILHYLGHQKVSVLDGGFPKWQREGRFISTDSQPVSGQVFPVDRMERHLATAEWILDHATSSDLVIIDVRSPLRYVDNHIPGAINIPWDANLNEDDTWKNAEDLRQMYERAGVTKDKNIVVYCQGGDHNAHAYLTLKALGYPRVRSYDRAWPEWSADPSLPKVEGTAPGSLAAALGVSSPVSAGLQQGAFPDQAPMGLLNAIRVTLIGVIVILGALLVVVSTLIWRTTGAAANAGGGVAWGRARTVVVTGLLLTAAGGMAAALYLSVRMAA